MGDEGGRKARRPVQETADSDVCRHTQGSQGLWPGALWPLHHNLWKRQPSKPILRLVFAAQNGAKGAE